MNERYASFQEAFERDGYVYIAGFLTPSEVDEVEVNLNRFIQEVVPELPPSEAMYEIKGRPESLKQLTGLQVDSFFARLLSDPKVVQLAEALLQGAVEPKHIQFFNKPPGLGKPTPPHQDGYYFCLVPNLALTAWIALDDIDEGNGALGYLRGSHKKGLIPHDASHVLGFSQGLGDRAVSSPGEEIIFHVKRGDCLLHHSLMVHSAGGNPSHRQRRALGMVYYAKRARIDEEAKQRYSDSLKRQSAEKG